MRKEGVSSVRFSDERIEISAGRCSSSAHPLDKTADEKIE